MYCPSIPVCLPVCLSRSTPKPAKYADACSLVDIHRYPRTINELFFSWSFMTYPVYESWTSWVSNDLLVILCLGTVLYPLLYNIILFDIICVYSFTHYCWLWSGDSQVLPPLSPGAASRAAKCAVEEPPKGAAGGRSGWVVAHRSHSEPIPHIFCMLIRSVISGVDTFWHRLDSRWSMAIESHMHGKGRIIGFWVSWCQKMRNL